MSTLTARPIGKIAKSAKKRKIPNDMLDEDNYIGEEVVEEGENDKEIGVAAVVPTESLVLGDKEDFTTTKSNQKKSGRKLSNLWLVFNPDCILLRNNSAIGEEDTTSNLVVCSHCNNDYYSRLRDVRNHLLVCPEFGNFLSNVEVIPDAVLNDVAFKKILSSTSYSSSQKKTTTAEVKKLFVPQRSDKEEVVANIYFAMAAATGGPSFNSFNNSYLRLGIRTIRPKFEGLMADQKQLCGKYLDLAFYHTQRGVESKLRKRHCKLTLITGGGSKVNSDPVMNYVAHNTKDGFYLDTIATGAQGHSAESLFSDFETVLQQHNITDLIALLTENTSANKACWKLVEAKYPNILALGCVAHALHLLVKDILLVGKKEPGPANYPFRFLIKLVEDCTEIATAINKTHSIKVLVEQQQLLMGKPNIKMFGKKRWGDVSTLLSSVRESEGILRFIFTDSSLFDPVKDTKSMQRREKLESIVTGKQFVDYLEYGIQLFQPINDLLVKYHGSKVPISEVYHDFTTLMDKILESNKSISPEGTIELQRLITHHWQFMQTDAHNVAYMIDPRYLGYKMDVSGKNKCKDFLIKYSRATNPDVKLQSDAELSSAIQDELNSFTIEAYQERKSNQWKEFVEEYKINGSDAIILYFFERFLTEYPLITDAAVRIFAAVCSSATVDKSLVTMGILHNKLRNRMSNSMLHRLTYCNLNAACFDVNPDGVYESFNLMKSQQIESNIVEGLISIADGNASASSTASGEQHVSEEALEMYQTLLLLSRNSLNDEFEEYYNNDDDNVGEDDA